MKLGRMKELENGQLRDQELDRELLTEANLAPIELVQLLAANISNYLHYQNQGPQNYAGNRDPGFYCYADLIKGPELYGRILLLNS